jgi:peptide/nickel transport system substrate-binding protein
MRLIFMLGGIVAALLCAEGPALAQKNGGVLRVYHRENPPSASIFEEATISTVVPFMPLFNNLVLYDQHEPQNSSQTIRPELATSWRWNEAMTELTFQLRQGVKWHDGKPFTAKDVLCTFDLLTDKAPQRLRRNPRRSWFDNVGHVSMKDDYQVTLHLRQPQPSILAMLASGYTPMYPCHVSPAQMRSRPIGTGPFKLAIFNEFQYVRVVRNPDYWRKGRPYLDSIEFTVVNTPSTAILSFVAGRFDLTFPWEVTPSDLRIIKRESPKAVCETTSMNLNLNLLVNRDAPPFDNADIRRALLLAIDRKAFIEALTQGTAEIGGTMQPPKDGVWGLSPDVLAGLPGFGPDVEQNRAEARGIMERLGYGPNNRLKFKISTRGLPLYREPAELLQGQLKEIHVDAELEMVETSLWFNRLGRKEFSLGVNATGNGIDDPDQTLFENFACKSARNYARYCNPDLERLFDEQSREIDQNRRRALVNEIDVRLLADGARPPLYWNRATTCHQAHVKGYVSMVNSIYNGFRFEDVWLDR